MTSQTETNQTGSWSCSAGKHDNSSTVEFIPPEIFISNHERAITESVVDLGISLALSVLGIVCNVIVLTVFIHQGFKKSVNISMSTIAIWDLIKCLAAAFQRMAGPIGLVSSADALSWANINTASMLYLMTFTNYVSSALAAYVALERCMCVIMPFHVKILLSPRVTFTVMILLSTVVFGCFAVIFAIYDIVWVFSPRYNTTIAVYRYSHFFNQHNVPLMKYYNLVGVLWPTLSFVLILVCTIVIVHQLQASAEFRAGGKTGVDATTSRDKQVVKMLLVIIIIYAICLFPRIILYLTKYFVCEFYFLRQYHNIFVFICYWIFFLDLVNGTANMFVFLTMNTSFRDTFVQLFGWWKLKKPEKFSSNQN